MQVAPEAPPSHTPFASDDPVAYRRWRERKLRRAAAGRARAAMPIPVTASPAQAKLDRIRAACRHNNFALLRFDRPPADPPAALARLGDALDLGPRDRHLCSDPSGFSRLGVRDTATDNAYVPYSPRPLNWHTDGYYHPPERRVLAWLLYCACDAAEGGDNLLLDHEIAYLRLRDADPELAAALMSEDALTIPANVEQGGALVRPAQSGPVFAPLDRERLHMRYTARRKYIVWNDDEATRAAADFLTHLLDDGDEFMIRVRLEPGDVLLSNNVLHCRSAFRDDPAAGKQRLLYRGRYFRSVGDPRPGAAP